MDVSTAEVYLLLTGGELFLNKRGESGVSGEC